MRVLHGVAHRFAHHRFGVTRQDIADHRERSDELCCDVQGRIRVLRDRLIESLAQPAQTGRRPVQVEYGRPNLFDDGLKFVDIARKSLLHFG